jgi:hypothetical protein
MKTSNITWLAGLCEGEAHFGYHRRNDTPLIAIQMTDQDVLEKASIFLGRSVGGPYGRPGNRKDAFRLQATGSKAAGLMMTLHGLMGNRRQLQIESALKKWLSKTDGRTVEGRPWSHNGNCVSCHRNRHAKPINCESKEHKTFYEKHLKEER